MRRWLLATMLIIAAGSILIMALEPARPDDAVERDATSQTFPDPPPEGPRDWQTFFQPTDGDGADVPDWAREHAEGSAVQTDDGSSAPSGEAPTDPMAKEPVDGSQEDAPEDGPQSDAPDNAPQEATTSDAPQEATTDDAPGHGTETEQSEASQPGPQAGAALSVKVGSASEGDPSGAGSEGGPTLVGYPALAAALLAWLLDLLTIR